jgi:hypothetical protein
MTTRLELAEGIAEAAGYVVVSTETVRAIESIEARWAIGVPITDRELSDVLFACAAAGWRSKTFCHGAVANGRPTPPVAAD